MSATVTCNISKCQSWTTVDRFDEDGWVGGWFPSLPPLRSMTHRVACPACRAAHTDDELRAKLARAIGGGP